MATITDPDDLTLGTQVVIDTTAFTFQLVPSGAFSNAGSTGGVTGQALYSFFKDVWKSQANLIPYPFPAITITPEQFEFTDGWTPADDATRNLLRSCGWREIAADNTTKREYMGIMTLGDIDAGDTVYHAFAGDATKTDFDFPGPVNQGIQTFGDTANGNFNKRALVLTTYIRTRAKTYGSATSSSIGLGELNYIANRFPLAEALDTKISASDTAIQNDEPYASMTITYGAITRDFNGSTDFSFDVLINGNNGTAEEIYEFVQYSLRLGTDIDADATGNEIGNLANSLVNFVGNDLKTTTGVYIDGFLPDDTNRLIFTDTGNVERAFPFLASGNLLANANLVGDGDAIYRMFFANTFGTVNATLVEDAAGNPISGDFAGNESIGFDFDYAGNNQQGRPANSETEVIVVAIGLNSAQYVSAPATIVRASGQNISLVSPLERNYTA